MIVKNTLLQTAFSAILPILIEYRIYPLSERWYSTRFVVMFHGWSCNTAYYSAFLLALLLQLKLVTFLWISLKQMD